MPSWLDCSTTLRPSTIVARLDLNRESKSNLIQLNLIAVPKRRFTDKNKSTVPAHNHYENMVKRALSLYFSIHVITWNTKTVGRSNFGTIKTAFCTICCYLTVSVATDCKDENRLKLEKK